MFKPAKEMKVTAATVFEQQIEKEIVELRPIVAKAIETSANLGFFHASIDYCVSGFSTVTASRIKKELTDLGYKVSIQCGSICVGWEE